MKKLLPIAAFALFFSPCIANARALMHGWPGTPPTPHTGISAPEMGNTGFAMATMIGVAGILILRKRTTD